MLNLLLNEHEFVEVVLQKSFEDNRAPFLVRANKTSSSFATELRKLRALGFIKQIGEEGVRSLLQEDGKERNVCDFFEITERGREYIQLRTQINALESNQSAT